MGCGLLLMKELFSKLKEFDIAGMLPNLTSFIGWVKFLLGFMVVIGPLVMLGMGLWFFFRPPKEANHSVGFRTKWSMSSVEVWQYAQRLSGFVYMVLGGGLFLITFILTLFFGVMQMPAMVITALVCVILEALLALAAYIFVEYMLRKYFDQDGYRR